MVGGIPIPGLASMLSDPTDGTSTVIQGLDDDPADDRPTVHEVNVMHLAWDVDGRTRHAAVPADALVLGGVDLPTRHAREPVVPASPATTGVLAVITLEAGWTVSEVGRQPWIVYEKMKVEDAATANTGIWITFIRVRPPLRRPWRDDDRGPARDEPSVPER